MRMPFAKTALASVLTLLTAANTGSAQTGRASLGPSDLGSPQWADAPVSAPGGPGAGWEAGPIGVPGAMFQPQYGTMPPQALYPPNAPNTMNPWPAISPFEPPNVSYTQHQNKRGLWFRDTVHRKTDYEFSMEYIRTSFEQPRDTLIGSTFEPYATAADGSLDPFIPIIQSYGLAPTSGQYDNSTVRIFPGANPYPFLLISAAPIVKLAIVDGTLFPIHTLGALEGGLDSNGVRLRYGAMHEDGTGWSASGFWANETPMQFSRGLDNVNGIPITQLIAINNPAIMFVRNGGLPLIYSDDLFGGDHVPGYLGETQKYDLLYRLKYDTTGAGAELNHYTGLMHKGENTRVTSFVGARYFLLNENFSFHGIDSGLGYEFELDPEDEFFLRPDPGSILFDHPLMHSRLNSNVESHMAGAQGGFRVDIGHHGAFHVWTQTTGGLLANYESLEITGDNIGVAGQLERFDMHDGVQFLDNSFRDKERHTHVSPLFEQSIFADIRLKHVMPFLKKSYLLEEAQFRVGYTFTWIGYISRPGSSINWQGFPRFPSVKVNRENFTMNQMTLGLTFPY